MARRRLSEAVAGSGLVPHVEELLPSEDTSTPQPPPEAIRIPLSKIHRTFTFTADHKPLRQYHDLERIRIWAENDLAVNGVQSPIWVRPHPTIPDEFELVSGMRRTLGSEIIALPDILSIVRNWTDAQAYAAAISENANREDFSPLEETDNTLNLLSMKLDLPVQEVVPLLRRLYNNERRNPEHNIMFKTQIEQIQAVFDFLGQGKWQSFTQNRLPLLKLPEDILEVLRTGKIQYTKGLMIAKVKDEADRSALLEQAVSENWSLAQIQEAVTAFIAPKKTQPADSLKQRWISTIKQFNQTKAYDDPKKAVRLEKLLKEVNKILEG